MMWSASQWPGSAQSLTAAGRAAMLGSAGRWLACQAWWGRRRVRRIRRQSRAVTSRTPAYTDRLIVSTETHPVTSSASRSAQIASGQRPVLSYAVTRLRIGPGWASSGVSGRSRHRSARAGRQWRRSPFEATSRLIVVGCRSARRAITTNGTWRSSISARPISSRSGNDRGAGRRRAAAPDQGRDWVITARLICVAGEGVLRPARGHERPTRCRSTDPTDLEPATAKTAPAHWCEGAGLLSDRQG